jgi:hypothetical protein
MANVLAGPVRPDAAAGPGGWAPAPPACHLGAAVFTADPDVDLDYSLSEWRRWRKRRRIAELAWIDALYHAELTGIACAIAFYALAGVIGDGALSAGQMADVTRSGDAWLGLAAAVALAVGLRSGSRGGPLVLEAADVRHVLLSPVDRRRALRGPALRQIRFLLFVAASGGLAVGFLAAHRLAGSTAAWTASAAAFALATVALAFGAALVASSLRLPSWAGTTLGIVLVGAAAADAADVVPASPTVPWGRIGMWPVQPAAPGVVAVGISLAVLALGLARLGRVSLESAERRSRLVGQLRFAATLQDVRTVVLLRRQLALELPRLRPWVRLRVGGRERLPVWHRGLRGALRWPAARVGRLVLLGVVAGLALRGVWAGTTPLLALAGAAVFLAGLDATEAMAQELDHPSLTESTPAAAPSLRVRHLAVALAVMALVAAVGVAAAVLVEPGAGALELALLCAPAAALGGVAGAGASLVATPDPLEAMLMPPEVTGAYQAFRIARPLVLAIAGTLPVLAARAAAGAGGSALDAAGTATVAVGAGFGVFVLWLRHREALQAFLQASLGTRKDRRP